MNAERHKSEAKRKELDHAVDEEAAARKGPPKLDTDRLRALGVKLVAWIMALLKTVPPVPAKKPIAAVLVLLVESLTAAFAALEKSAGTWRRAVAPHQLWTPAVLAAAEAAAAVTSGIRKTVSSRVTGANPVEVEVREAFGVGRDVHPGSVLAVKDFVNDQLRALAQPEFAALLAARGVFVEAAEAELEAVRVALEDACTEGPGTPRPEARAVRDAAQVKVEILLSRVSAAIYALAGPAKVEEFEALWPRNQSGKRALDPVPDSPVVVVTPVEPETPVVEVTPVVG